MIDETGNRTYGSCSTLREELTNELIESFIPIFNDEINKYYIEKGICLISYFPFYYNCLNFLKYSSIFINKYSIRKSNLLFCWSINF